MCALAFGLRRGRWEDLFCFLAREIEVGRSMVMMDVPSELLATVGRWMMFETERKQIPSMQKAAPEILFRKFTKQDKKGEHSFPECFDAFGKPWLTMTEGEGDTWRMGSLWALEDTGVYQPMSSEEGSPMPLHLALRHIARFAFFEVDGCARMIITSKDRHDHLRFSKAQELGPDILSSKYGLVDAGTGQVICDNETYITYKSCLDCTASENVCDCNPFLPARIVKRKSFLQNRLWQEKRRAVGCVRSKYTRSLLAGLWMSEINDCLVSSFSYFVTSGDFWRKCLSSVVQAEMLALLQPSFGLLSDGDSSPTYPTRSPDEKKRSPAKGKKNLQKSNAKTFRCPITGCSAIIKREFDIQRHIRCVHENTREHECSICSQTFAQRGHLNAHVKLTHHRIYDYMCSECGKGFGNKSKLTRHINAVHANLRSFACNSCPKRYKENQSLHKHILAKHKKQL